MNSIVTDDFVDCFARLPEAVREQARRAYQLWQANPYIPASGSSQFKVMTTCILFASAAGGAL